MDIGVRSRLRKNPQMGQGGQKDIPYPNTPENYTKTTAGRMPLRGDGFEVAPGYLYPAVLRLRQRVMENPRISTHRVRPPGCPENDYSHTLTRALSGALLSNSVGKLYTRHISLAVVPADRASTVKSPQILATLPRVAPKPPDQYHSTMRNPKPRRIDPDAKFSCGHTYGRIVPCSDHPTNRSRQLIS